MARIIDTKSQASVFQETLNGGARDSFTYSPSDVATHNI